MFAAHLARTALRKADPNEGPLKSGPGTRQIGRFHEAVVDRVLGLSPRPLGTLEIYVRGDVGGFGHDHDPVRTNLQKAAEDGDLLLLSAGLEPQHTLAEQRDQGRVMGQNAHLALDTRHDNFIDVACEGSLFGRDDLEM
jgi:hypothetical protein